MAVIEPFYTYHVKDIQSALGKMLVFSDLVVQIVSALRSVLIVPSDASCNFIKALGHPVFA